MENVICPISDNAHRLAKQPALITEERTWTYFELDREIHALCQFLSNIGIQERSRVAFLSPSIPSTIFLFFALFRLRAIACPLSTRLPQEQITKHLERLLASHFLEPESLPLYPITSDSPLTHISLDHLATFLFTSGSSGTPKIACHSFANHYYNALGVIFPLKLDVSSRWLLSLPLYHVGGIAILFRCFLRGAAVVLSKLSAVEAILQYEISHLSCVPTQLIRWLKEPKETLEKIKHSLKCCLLGGAPAPDSLLQEANHHKLPLFLTYGMTEMSSIITLSEQQNNKILPFREIKIGEDQEIYVRGKTLFKGYLDDNKLNPEWFATKDLGRFNAQGNLEIIGRKDRQFISGGENIQPEEIEKALRAIPGIRHAIVRPIPDKEFGMRPIACIDDETNSHTLESIKLALQSQLPSFKHPIRLMPFPVESIKLGTE